MAWIYMIIFSSLMASLFYVFYKHNGRMPKPRLTDIQLLWSAIMNEVNTRLGRTKKKEHKRKEKKSKNGKIKSYGKKHSSKKSKGTSDSLQMQSLMTPPGPTMTPPGPTMTPPGPATSRAKTELSETAVESQKASHAVPPPTSSTKTIFEDIHGKAKPAKSKNKSKSSAKSLNKSNSKSKSKKL